MRFDNASYHRDILSFPHHIHLGEKIIENKNTSFIDIFSFIERNYMKMNP